MSTQYQEQSAFYSQLWYYYINHKKKIMREYTRVTRKFLEFNDREYNPDAFLRPPQFEALEMYIFLKEFLGNRQIADLFDDWRKRRGLFEDAAIFAREDRLFEYQTEKQTDIIFRQMKNNAEVYPNYIFALTMGLGKTILMATCIFYEFLLANKYPKDPRFCHNVLVFAPDRTVLQSLKEIPTFDKSLVLPPEYVAVIDNNLKVHFLEEPGTSLNTIDGSNFNLIISNDQKIIARRTHSEDSAVKKLFDIPSKQSLLSTVYGADDVLSGDDLVVNQRFKKLCRLQQMGVYIDEAHHVFGKDLEKSLSDKKNESSLRTTVNMLNGELVSKGTGVVACYNYTGTPYVNNKVLPEVVYAFGLSKSISNGYLKSARVTAYENVKSEAFLREVITDFWNRYGGNQYEGLLPKLAIFATNLDEVEEEVRPAAERILTDLNIPLSKILVNTGDPRLTSDEDIHIFNNLDNSKADANDKQFIILVQKGREGWNCRSLFGVALFRSPKSKVFVLQATMRCLRQITKEQQEASVYLSKENFDTLDSELNKNYNMEIRELANSLKKERREYQVRFVPPEVKVTVSRLRHKYEVEQKEIREPIDFHLDQIDVSRYEMRVYEKSRIDSHTSVKERELKDVREQGNYTELTLVAEIARILGPSVSCIDLEKYLNESKEGIAALQDLVNKYPEILYDVIIPRLYELLFEVSSSVESKEEEVVLLRAPKDSSYYSFSALPELVFNINDDQFAQVKAKSFHADTYCFDSKPEKELFQQFIFSDRVKEVYFTGMFTSGQGDLSIQYCDPESFRIRSYYPDFYVVMNDGTVKLIEVKGDNKIDDKVVQAKAEVAREVAIESSIEYEMIAGSEIMSRNIVDNVIDRQSILPVKED